MDYQQLEINLTLSPQDSPKQGMIKVGDFCFYDDFPYTLIDFCCDNVLIGDIERDAYLLVKHYEIECLPDKLGNPGMWRVNGFEGDWENLYKEKNGGDIPDRFLLRNIKDQSVRWFNCGDIEYLGDLKGIFLGRDGKTYPERKKPKKTNKIRP